MKLSERAKIRTTKLGLAVKKEESDKSVTYAHQRIKDIQAIKELLKLGFEPIYFNNWISFTTIFSSCCNNWIKLGNYTFNGFRKNNIEELRKELI